MGAAADREEKVDDPLVYAPGYIWLQTAIMDDGCPCHLDTVTLGNNRNNSKKNNERAHLYAGYRFLAPSSTSKVHGEGKKS